MRGGGGDSVTAVDFMTSCKFLSPGGAVACRADKRLGKVRHGVCARSCSDDQASRATRARGRVRMECQPFEPLTEVV